MTTQKKPSISAYLDYRLFLQDIYNYLKVQKAQFSYRSFAKAARVNSPSFLKLVMGGKRNLSDESIEKFAHALQLNNDECEFFRTLVKYNQATTIEEKMRNYKWLQRLKSDNALDTLLGSPEQEFWERWFGVAMTKASEEGHTQQTVSRLEIKMNELRSILKGNYASSPSSNSLELHA